jgi:nitroreductase
MIFSNFPKETTLAEPSAVPELVRLQSLLQQRHSCRAFLASPVDDALIRQLLEAARHTASWCNAQPWEVLVTRGAATEAFRRAYSDWAAAHPAAPDHPFPREYAGVYLERRRECGWALYDSVGIARGDRAASARQAARNFEFFGAPHVAIVTSDARLGVYGAIDCGAWVGNFMLAATAAGLGCIAQAALAAHPDLIRRHFSLPDTRQVVCGVAFGYEDREHPANRFRTSRAPLEDTVRWY